MKPQVGKTLYPYGEQTCLFRGQVGKNMQKQAQNEGKVGNGRKYAKRAEKPRGGEGGSTSEAPIHVMTVSRHKETPAHK